MNRESIYSAFWDLVKDLPDFITTSRRLQHWTDVAANQQPALYMSQKGETAESVTRIPTKWKLDIDLWVYVHGDGTESGIPATALNTCVQAVLDAIKPNLAAADEQTLGGQVYRCRVEGRVQTDEGVLGDQAVAVIPVVIMATDEP